MRWRDREQSSNVQDKRGTATVKKITLGGAFGTIVLLLLMLALGVEPKEAVRAVLQQHVSSATDSMSYPSSAASAEANERAQFVGVVLADTEKVWREQFTKMGLSYREPQLVLFSGSVRSGCGYASAATGPFYCPVDEKVYIDLDFFRELKERYKAPGEFAQAYVIAHEIGHHVQKQLGITDQVHALHGRLSEKAYNQLSVRLELQADFLAGVFANHAQQRWKFLEPGDIEAALNAASAIGDDHIQKQTQGHVTPDSFTHGTSAQRIRWFRKGLETGDLSQGDTFSAKEL